jgi:DNA-binding LytR/AlgR family response regulator
VRVAIVEDDAAAAQLLLNDLRTFETENEADFELTVFTDGAQIVKDYRPEFDILLLDVEMPDLDGFSAAAQIRLVDPEVLIVFVTASPQYAIKGYEVDALSYLLKPVKYFQFSQLLKKSLAKLATRQVDAISLKIAGGYLRVPLNDIVFLESKGHRTQVNTFRGGHSVVGSLKELEAKLEGKRFFRSNSGYLVNLRHLKAVSDNAAVMSSGHKLAISRARNKPLLQALADYLGEQV